MHQDIALHMERKGWLNGESKNLLRYTHHNRDVNDYLKALKFIDFVIVENSRNRDDFVTRGIPSERVLVLPHPVNRSRFNPFNSNRNRDVIVVSNFYERKRPDLIVHTIKRNPHISFSILGRKWENFSKNNDLRSLPNLKMMNFDWESYPQVLKRHRVFLSLSDVESGPVPLLESLSCGLNPVVTDTGTARDLLSDNRLIVPTNPRSEQIDIALQFALDLPNKSEPFESHLPITEEEHIRVLFEILSRK
jgi:glycosyltransferase involved in cell wall biosynthesis